MRRKSKQQRKEAITSTEEEQVEEAAPRAVEGRTVRPVGGRRKLRKMADGPGANSK